MAPPPTHILVFPYPAQGHLPALLDLAHKLAAGGLSVTVLVTPGNLSALDPLLLRSRSEGLAFRPLVLPFPASPHLPPGAENAQHLTYPYYPHLMHALASLAEPIAQWVRTHPDPPVAIVSDFFLGWTARLAHQLGIPRITFYCVSALTVSIFRHVWTHLPQRPSDRSHEETFPIRFEDLPSSPTLSWAHLPQIYRRYQESEPVSEFLRDMFQDNHHHPSGWGSVFHSFGWMEQRYLDHLGQFGRVWAVGPLLLNDGDRNPVGAGGLNSDPIIEWLDSKSDRSVVYICFGSQVVLSNRQMEGLASGLESSGLDFVWCVKEPNTQGLSDDQYGKVPGGFEERVKGRGLVWRGWVPQVLVLEHRSIAAFLTHCGWNSTLEGMAVGLPLLAWPMGADQFINAWFIVEELGIGVRVCEGAQTVPDPDQLSRTLVEVIHGGDELRDRAVELKTRARQAVSHGGTSFRDLDMLVEQLSSLNAPKRATSTES